MTKLNKNFATLFNDLSKDDTYLKALQIGKSRCNIKLYKVQSLTPEKISQMYKSVNKKFYQNDENSIDQGWFENQLKIFVWLLVGYMFVYNKFIRQFTQYNWAFFSQIFNERPSIFLEFQARLIIKPKRKANQWDNAQIQMLKKIIKQIQIYARKKLNANRWNLIAKELFVLSKRAYFRTPKQCREKWLNHLDPMKKRSAWTVEEDQVLLNFVKEDGKKWSNIVRIMNNTRTQHMVKNRYKSIILNAQKNYKNNIAQSQILEQVLKNIQNSKLNGQLNLNKNCSIAQSQRDSQQSIDEQFDESINQQRHQKSIQKSQAQNNQQDVIMEQQETSGKYTEILNQQFALNKQLATYSTKFGLDNSQQRGDVNHCPFFQECADQSIIPFMSQDSVLSSLISKDQKDHLLQNFFFF